MKTGKKISGGKYRKARSKKRHELEGQRRVVKLGDESKKTKRGRGGENRTVLLKSNILNLKVKGKNQKTEIKNVLETPSNRFLARQNILTKGTIVETSLGNAKITNRPSQEGMINGILIEEKTN